MIERDELRFQMRMMREKASALQVMEMSARIGERVLALPEYKRACRIFCYHALPMEVQTAGLIREMIREGKEVYLPVLGKRRTMRAVRLRESTMLHKGAFGVYEPDGNEEIDPARLELILTPGLAFDRMGGRIGYGAGYFDRFLPKCKGLIVALALEMQMVERVPMEAHDVYMHRIITEQTMYCCTEAQGRG